MRRSALRPSLLDQLDFGMVDAESEPLLARRFIRTADFDKFLDSRYLVVVGAKGSGKSALFEMFAKNTASVRQLAGSRLDNVLVGPVLVSAPFQSYLLQTSIRFAVTRPSSMKDSGAFTFACAQLMS